MKKVGDIILLEECWEDESGFYHDEYAEITAIRDNGEMELVFQDVSDEVIDYLSNFTFNVNECVAE